MIYLASPYSGTRDEESIRYFQAMKATARLLKSGIIVYSPIVHCHNMAIMYKLPKDFKFWQWYNEAMIEVAEGLCVLKLKGWEESKGVAHEIEYAKSLKYIIDYIDE